MSWKIARSCAATVGFALLNAVAGCAPENPDEPVPEDFGKPYDDEPIEGQQSALYDSTVKDDTARAALREAQRRTIANGDKWEYCGLIVLKVNGGYRASAPVTQRNRNACQASTSLAQGERVTGGYHTHPSGVQPGFSQVDLDTARRNGWDSYLANEYDEFAKYVYATDEVVFIGYL